MTCLMLVFTVLFPGCIHLNLMIWDMASIGSVPLLLMEMHYRFQITGHKGRAQMSMPRKMIKETSLEARSTYEQDISA